MATIKALQMQVGSLSNPSKMPGFGYSTPAKDCQTGSKLAKIVNSICSICYAAKGRYLWPTVATALKNRLATIELDTWVDDMVEFIGKKEKSGFFRWHDSGDVQDLDHLKKIYAVCRLTPGKRHWLPTREAWIKQHLHDKPDNLVIRFSAPMIDQAAPESWPNTSTVVTSGASCPAPEQNNECRDCRQCWDPGIKNISYGKH